MQPSRLRNDPWAATAHKMREMEANLFGSSGGTSSTLMSPQPVVQSGIRFPMPVHEVKKEIVENDMMKGPSPSDLAYKVGANSVCKATSEVTEVKKEEVDKMLLGPQPPKFVQPVPTKLYRGGNLYVRQELSLPPASGSSGFTCVECGRSCPNRDSIRKHVARVHEKRYVDSARKTYPCERPGCDMVLKTLKALRDHHNDHDGAYECGTCAKTFIALAGLAKHLNVYGSSSIGKEEGEEDASSSSTDFHEKRSSNSTSNELPPLFSNDVHVKMEPLEENREYLPPLEAMSSSFSNEVGEKVELQQPTSSRTVDSLERHMSEAHNKYVGDTSIGKKSIKCDTSGKVFGLQKEKQHHSYYCSRSAEIKQQRAEKKVLDMVALGRDRTPQSPVIGRIKLDKSCPICGLVFSSNQSKNRHIGRKHAGGDISILAAVFPVLQRATTNEDLASRPFHCAICNSAFTTRAGLTIHERREHNKDPSKMYPCLKCGRMFPLQAELRKHEKKSVGLVMCRSRGRGGSTPSSTMTTPATSASRSAVSSPSLSIPLTPNSLRSIDEHEAGAAILGIDRVAMNTPVGMDPKYLPRPLRDTAAYPVN